MSKQKFDFDLDEDLGADEEAAEFPAPEQEEESFPSVESAPTPRRANPQRTEESVAASMVEDLFGTTHSSDNIDLDKDIKQRLDVAKYYNMLFTTNLFAEHDSPAAARVQREIMRFAEGRLKDLMGISGKSANTNTTTIVNAKLPFTDPQVEALKMLADKMLQQKGVQTQAAQLPPAPKIEKAPEPVLKPLPKVQAPEKPRVAEVKNEVKPPVAKTKPPLKKPLPNTMTDAERQEFIQARVPPQYQGDESLKIKDGKAFIHVRNGDNELLFVYDPVLKKTVPMMKDITAPNKPKGYTPSTYQEGNRIAESQSSGMLNAAVTKIEERARVLANDGRGRISTGIIGDQMGMALINAFKEGGSSGSDTDINDM